ncbi:MAG: tetratricopeptide repeat protein [Vulcanimicrobiota bacterium]
MFRAILLLWFLGWLAPLARAQPARTEPDVHYWQRALQQVLDGRIDSALQSINQEIQDHPDEADAYRARASLLVNFFKDPSGFARALDDYDRTQKLAPDQDADFFLQRARLLTRMDQPGRAISDLDRFLELDPGYPLAYYLRARCHWSLAEFEAATNDLNKTLQLAPDLAEAYGLRGIIHLQYGRRAEGLADLEKALALDPNSSYRADLEAARTAQIGADGSTWAKYLSPDGDFRLELPVPVRANSRGEQLVVASALAGGHMFGVVRHPQDAQSKLWKIDSAECRKAVFHFLEVNGARVIEWKIESYQGRRCLHARTVGTVDQSESDTVVVLTKKYIYLVACVRPLNSPAFDPERQSRFRHSFRILK